MSRPSQFAKHPEGQAAIRRVQEAVARVGPAAGAISPYMVRAGLRAHASRSDESKDLERWEEQRKRDSAVNAARLEAARAQEEAQRRADAVANAAALKAAGLTTSTPAPAPVAAPARFTTDQLTPAEARRFDHLVELRANLASLAPGLRLDGRAPDFLAAALEVARSEPAIRSRPDLVELRAQQRLDSEAAYQQDVRGAGGRTAPRR